MSRATSLNPERAAQKAASAERRAARRERRSAKVQELQDWFQERRIQAAKARAEKAKAPTGPRGVDRVPTRLKVGRTVSLPVETPELGISTLPDGRRIQGSYADRRRAGARGKTRRPRRRELAQYAVAEMTKAERSILETEMAKAEKAGSPMTPRQVAGRAWAIMRDARFPQEPRRGA